jgi:hypothetical protein
MAKRPKRTSRKSQSTVAKTQALIQKENRERVERLVATARENGLMARRIAAASNLPKNVPPALMRQFRAALKKATNVRRPKVSRATVR